MLDELPADFDLRAHYAEVQARLYKAPPARALPATIYPEPIGPKPIVRDVWRFDRASNIAGPVGPIVPERDPRTGAAMPFSTRVRVIVLDVLARHPRVTWGDVLSNRRMGYISLARQIICWRLSKYTIMSLPQIGRVIGGKDHSTVHHAVRKIDRLLAAGKLTIEQTGGRAQP